MDEMGLVQESGKLKTPINATAAINSVVILFIEMFNGELENIKGRKYPAIWSAGCFLKVYNLQLRCTPKQLNEIRNIFTC